MTREGLWSGWEERRGEERQGGRARVEGKERGGRRGKGGEERQGRKGGSE